MRHASDNSIPRCCRFVMCLCLMLAQTSALLCTPAPVFVMHDRASPAEKASVKQTAVPITPTKHDRVSPRQTAKESTDDISFSSSFGPDATPPAEQRDTARAVKKSQYHEEGIAAYYANSFQGRKTASGERYDRNSYTAAHRTLPFGTQVRVTNPVTKKGVTLRVNDRGPFTKGRIIDVSYIAAQELGLIGPGFAKVIVESAP